MVSEFPLIEQTPGVMGGRACLKGLRVTVGTVVTLLSEGTTIDDILDAYPYITREHVLEALRYVADHADGL